MKVLEVNYVKDYTISVKFDDGITGIIQLDDLVQKGIFQLLKNKELFSKVYTNGYSIAWSDNLEIDIANIYSEITGKNFGEIINPKFSYATN